MSQNSSSFFNAHHCPIGAFAGFVLGYPDKKGGFSIEMGSPPNENVYIGAESAERPGVFQALPFYEVFVNSDRNRYAEECMNEEPLETTPFSTGRLDCINQEDISRDFKLGSDSFTAGDMTFTILSQARSIPEPGIGDDEETKQTLVPAVLAEMTLDNSNGQHDRRVFFGFQGNDAYSCMRQFTDDETGLVGIGQGGSRAIVSKDVGTVSGQGFEVIDILNPTKPENRVFGIAPHAALVNTVPAGQRKTFRFAICFYRDGVATQGIETSYYYTKYFQNIEEVGNYALANFDAIKDSALQADAMVESSNLSDDQKFQLAHAIRSYYYSSELLIKDGEPLWVVNEGEYRMMNTFDLTADHSFFEMKMNPWVLRNALDLFVDRYSYRDTVHFHGDETSYPGGLSFTHDMGVANTFSRPEYSSYELFGLSECFSHMTHEQLVNWVLCASMYAIRACDEQWLDKRLPVFTDCLESLVNRDHPDPEKRNGIMSLDSDRSKAEITTFDSLDVSLGQARNNLYLGVKTFAAYISLETIFKKKGLADLAEQAVVQAGRAAATIVSKAEENGMIPAVFENDNQSRIISAIEGLAFPYLIGRAETVSADGPYAELIAALKAHLQAILKPGICLFEDGGWKLSATSNNSWLSKIYLSQFVAKNILGVVNPEQDAAADAAHVSWLTNPDYSFWCWSDQILKGIIWGSKYYPRGVTSILWLEN